ncbi:glycosyltransferase family 2 protein [Pseudofulvibacter geojedonensis]|uniref:Glycosyltransferase family 2 protein n=1 Tax=Pseudofulvibacter geojedonensis TaxID=1123758 RepID=A0ABW3HYV3_9FLAO
MNINKVSIIMATYNRAHYIVETLASIKKQTHENWECIIVDDGGTDNTQEVVLSFIEKDDRFQFFKRTNKYGKGLPGARNFGLDKVTGDFIVFFDDDDIIHPQALEVTVASLVSSKRDFCHYKKKSFTEKFDYNFKKIQGFDLVNTKENFLEQMVLNKIGIASCTVLWKRECFKDIRFNESLMYAEEWECYQRIFSNDTKGIIINPELYFNRKHIASNTGEFWNNDPIRVNSKKKAIYLVAQNLKKKNKLSTILQSYFLNCAIAYRDKKLLIELIKLMGLGSKDSSKVKIKYLIFPIWKRAKSMLKSLKNK